MGIERTASAGPAAWARRPEAADAAGGMSGKGAVKLKRVEEPEALAPPPALAVVVEEINQLLADARREIAFSIDEGSGRTVVRVIDANSGDVVRQMPSEEVLKLADQLRAAVNAQSIGVDQWS